MADVRSAGALAGRTQAGDVEELVEERFERGQGDEGDAREVLDDGADGGLGERPGVVGGEDVLQRDGFGDGAACR